MLQKYEKHSKIFIFTEQLLIINYQLSIINY